LSSSKPLSPMSVRGLLFCPGSAQPPGTTDIARDRRSAWVEGHRSGFVYGPVRAGMTLPDTAFAKAHLFD